MDRRNSIPALFGILLTGMSFLGCQTPPDMVQIPAGCFQMGNSFPSGDSDERPVHTVCFLLPFSIDLYEVTNAKYAECVAAEACTAPSRADSYTRPTYYGDPAYDNYPVIWVTWEQGNEYCTWAKKRLPTEAEWEYAARGDLAGNMYSWGDTISGSDANYRDSGDPEDNDTNAVGSYPANGYGLYDVAGNIWEWTNDWYDSVYYQYCVDNRIRNDPQGPPTGTFRAMRGGSYSDFTHTLRVAGRDMYSSSGNYRYIGFRCAQ